MKTVLRILTQTAALLVCGSVVLAQPQPTLQEQVVALKASLAASQAILKSYEWIETTVVSLKGEEKSRQMNRCYHGADGKVQKVPVTAPPAAEKKRGLRGKIAESKKEELADYMKEAVSLVKMYVPLDPARIQAAKDTGKLSFTPLPAQRMRLTINDYLKPGDSVVVEVDQASSRPLGAKISTKLDEAKDVVTLDVRFSTLENNATYASTVALDAKAKNLTVNLQNSGYRQAGK
jgi:hypothetical protein